jgi:glycosyltransferase involved in cell wall biosynthesis
MGVLSVTIIAKNEAASIEDCVVSASELSTDIVVADSGSSDGTPALAQRAGATVAVLGWKGYGPTRNAAADIAIHDWILSLDADERLTPELAVSINQLVFTKPDIVYGFRRANFLGTKRIHHGEWGRDKVYRLYNKTATQWNAALVHETIDMQGLRKQLVSGYLLHYTMKDLKEYKEKSRLYARLSAQKYAAAGKKSIFIKRFLAPVFSFIQNYFFRAGFLDGAAGFGIACVSSHYVYLKYKLLQQIYSGKEQLQS